MSIHHVREDELRDEPPRAIEGGVIVKVVPLDDLCLQPDAIRAACLSYNLSVPPGELADHEPADAARMAVALATALTYLIATP